MLDTTDQFIHIRDGYGLVKRGINKDKLNYQREVESNYAILVPAGTWYNIINIGNRPLKLYSVYASPIFPYGTIEKNNENIEDD